jgi:DNA-binding FrmR family transcriptional regulator
MQVQFTTTLPETILKQINSFAKATGKKKNQILEESLLHYFRAEKAKKMAESFKKAALDQEIILMAEDGLDDSKEQFDALQL